MTRKIILYVHMTLNGVVTGDPALDKEDFGGQWTNPGNLLGEASETLVRLFERVDTILLGRGSFQTLSKRWPEMQASDGAEDVTARLANLINSAKKLVVTRCPAEVDMSWGGFEPGQPIDSDDVTARVRQLRRGDAGDIVIFGSPMLVRALADADLLDECYFVIHPVVVPVGDRLFEGVVTRSDLSMKSAVSLEGGGILVAYERERE